jgi:glycolate oxidase
MKGLEKDLRRLVPEERVRTDPEDLRAYAADATYYVRRGKPDAVVLPETTEEVSKVLRYAFGRTIPVTPRGAGTGLSGGATPLKGGIVLDMKRMRQVLEINRRNLSARVEAGVVLADFHRAVKKLGLFYPPNPQSMTVCTLGGNVATRACGPHGVKYGATGDYVLGLEVVLADGSVIEPGGDVVRSSAGYDLVHLFSGSEGTLGVITKIRLRLLPLPPAHRTVVVACETIEQAGDTVTEILAGGTLPAMIEFIPQMAVVAMNQYIRPPLTTQGQAYLLMDLDGTPDQIASQADHILGICRRMAVLDIRVIEDEKEAQSYWTARSNLGAMLLTVMKKAVNEDVAVPRDRIPEFVRGIQALSATLTKVVLGIGGHAGDGNMHPTILYPEVSDAAETEARATIEKVVRLGLSLGGTVSGEHGIGFHKAEFLALQLGPTQMELLKRIKKALDPKGILNPGKLWLDGR